MYQLHRMNQGLTMICSQVTVANTIGIARHVATMKHMKLGVNLGY